MSVKPLLFLCFILCCLGSWNSYMPASRRAGECGGLGSWCVREAKGGALFLALQAQRGYLCSAPSLVQLLLVYLQWVSSR